MESSADWPSFKNRMMLVPISVCFDLSDCFFNVLFFGCWGVGGFKWVCGVTLLSRFGGSTYSIFKKSNIDFSSGNSWEVIRSPFTFPFLCDIPCSFNV